MKKGTRGEAAIHVDAPPARLYALVSDVTRMGEWSPETIKCDWIDGGPAAAVGARFKGTNRRGIARWSTKPRVVVAEPDREFSFDVNGVTRWTYRFEPEGDGTRLVESFEMLRDRPWYFALTDRVMGIKDRRADLEQALRTTVERIKA